MTNALEDLNTNVDQQDSHHDFEPKQNEIISYRRSNNRN